MSLTYVSHHSNHICGASFHVCGREIYCLDNAQIAIPPFKPAIDVAHERTSLIRLAVENLLITTNVLPFADSD
jgi:hypothetical protein